MLALMIFSPRFLLAGGVGAEGCVDMAAPLAEFGLPDETCAQWAGDYDALGRCDVETFDLPGRCEGDYMCEAEFTQGNPLVNRCPATCGYCDLEYPNLLEPASLAVVREDAIGNFVIDGDYFCLQGPLRHMAFILSTLKSSALGGVHRNNTLQLGPCSTRGYDFLLTPPHGDSHDHCYPPAQLFHREVWVDHPIYGDVPVGELLEVQEVENDIIEDFNSRVSWEVSPDGDSTGWTNVACNCLEGSELKEEGGEDLSEESCRDWSQDHVASFVTDDGNSCVEAPINYANLVLAALRSSALARQHRDAQLEGTTCAERGFVGPNEADACYPDATRHFMSVEGQQEASEFETAAFEAYTSEHNETLANFPQDAVRYCSCPSGSPRRALLDPDCSDPALRSPVLDHWPSGSL